MTSPGKPLPTLWLRLGLSVVLAVLVLLALAPHLSAIPVQWDVAPWVVPAYLAVALAYALARAARWLFLVRPLGDVPVGTGLRVGLAGILWIALLPFRLGELARPLMLARCTDVGVRRAIGTIAVERVVDGLVVCGLYFATARATSASTLSTAATALAAVFATALAVLVLLGRFPRAARRIVEATVGRVLPRAGPWIADTAHAIADGLSALPRGGPLLGFLGVTALYWTSNALGMWLLAYGCGLPLSPSQCAAVMAVMNLVLLLPGGPAQTGTFQAGVALGLGLFLPADVVLARGSTYAFLLYACQLGTIVALGAWAQRGLPIDLRTVMPWSRRPEAP